MKITKILGIIFISLLSLQSCEEKACDNVVCANNGLCEGGACTCTEGYEGVRCETLSRQKFLGTYSVTEDGTISQPSVYSVNIHENGTADENINEVRLKGFYNYFEDEVVAECYQDSLTIPEQNLSGGYSVRGYGIFHSSDIYDEHGTLDLYYSLTFPSGKVNEFGYGDGEFSNWSK